MLAIAMVSKAMGRQGHLLDISAGRLLFTAFVGKRSQVASVGLEL